MIFLLIFEFTIYKNYNYCLNCYKNDIITSECYECPKEIIFKGLKILSDETTLNEIIKKNKSISRFGGGEFNIIFGKGTGFQRPKKKLIKRLIEVLNNEQKNLLIGLNIPYKEQELNNLISLVKNYWVNWFRKYKIKLAKLINKNRIYYSACITRFYMRYKDKKGAKKIIDKIKEIWNKKNILIIEGERSRLGVGNDLFDNAKSIKRIICPYKNAFKVYNKIIKEVIKLNEKRLILIALGPTASILAYDLNKLGYQSIDIGHIDIEYEWYLRNTTSMISIENKYVNEVKGHKFIIQKTNNTKELIYNQQIISKIKKKV